MGGTWVPYAEGPPDPWAPYIPRKTGGYWENASLRCYEFYLPPNRSIAAPSQTEPGHPPIYESYEQCNAVQRAAFPSCPAGTRTKYEWNGTNWYAPPNKQCEADPTIDKNEVSLGEALVGFGVQAASFVANPVPFVVNTYAQGLTQTLGEEGIMSLNIGGILSAASGVLSGVSSGNYLSALGSGLSGAAAAFQQQPVYAASPVYAMPGYSPPALPAPTMQAQPVGAFAVGAAVASRIAAMTAPILTKIAVKLGLRARPSLTRAMSIVRKAAKLLGSPEAVAVALGITTAELATLITAQSSRKHRRMNPANGHALRRAARRIKSFHRLCQHTDILKSRSRRPSGGCFKCGKKKCSC